jgi:hypothetical protein
MKKQFKNGPEVRAYLAKCRRDYRERKKQKASANAYQATAPADKTPDKTPKILKEVLSTE